MSTSAVRPRIGRYNTADYVQFGVVVDLKRLRVLTIVVPVAFVLGLELISLLVFQPLFGNNSTPRLFVTFLILIAGVLPFSFWVFAIIERQQHDLAQSAELLHSVKDYAIFMLDLDGRVMSWSPGAERVKGYRADEIIGKPLATFYPPEDVAQGVPAHNLEVATRTGRCETEGWRIRKDGSRFWASIVSTAVRDEAGTVLGFTHVTRDTTESKRAEDRIQALNEQLEVQVRSLAAANEEVRGARDRLEAWSRELEDKVAERTREIERHSKELTVRVLQAQEEERKRLARELHDDTAQSLSTLLINLDLLEPVISSESDALRAGLERIRSLTRQTLDNVRTLSHDLRPTILDDFGLIAALQWYADEYHHTFHVPVEMRIEQPPERLPPEVELALFRIAQEALTNSGKHAEADRARVSLAFPDSTVELTVEDDGKGFDPARNTGPTRHGGLGLYGMQERADLLGAILKVDTAPGNGTRVVVTVPLVHGNNGGKPLASGISAGNTHS